MDQTSLIAKRKLVLLFLCMAMAILFIVFLFGNYNLDSASDGYTLASFQACGFGGAL